MPRKETPKKDPVDPTIDLTDSQLSALGALAGGATISKAAETSGVHRSTVYRWLDADPVFMAELNRLRRERVEEQRANVRGLVETAFETVRKLLEDPTAPAAVRLKAAMEILRETGVMEGDAPIGSTDPEEIMTSIKQRESTRAFNRQVADLNILPTIL
jgi:transposase-like protein